MKEKKTEVITIRTTSSTRRALEKAAEEREWTTSKMAEKILSTWAREESKEEFNISFQQNTIHNIHIK